jgi:hypothetical protein
MNHPSTDLETVSAEPVVTNEPLSIEEKKKLWDLELIIERVRKPFLEAADAFLKIRDQRLYREKFATFEEYCRVRWGFGRRRADQIIQTARLLQYIPPEERKQIATERAARKVVQIAKESAKEEAELPKSCPMPVGCVNGLSPAVSILWYRRQEIKNLIKTLTDIKKTIQSQLQVKDLMYAEFQAVAKRFFISIDNAIADLELAVPYAVCPKCHGKINLKCDFCLGRGLLSKHRWETEVPDSLKKLCKT